MSDVSHEGKAPPAVWQETLLPQTTTFSDLSFASGVTVRGFQHDSYELENLPGCRDHLVAYRLTGVARAERRLGRSVECAVTRPGSITIVPAGMPSSWVIDGCGRLMYFFLPPALIDRVAAEFGHASGINLGERLGLYDHALGELACHFAREADLGLAGWALYAESIVTQLAVLLVRHHAGDRLRPQRRRGGLSPATRRRLLDHIAERLAQDISLADLAAVARLAPSHFSHSFRATFGCAPYQFVLRQRVGRARMLLESEPMPLVEIALASGFATQSHLTTQFKRLVGTTPAAYRARRNT